MTNYMAVLYYRGTWCMKPASVRVIYGPKLAMRGPCYNISM